MTSCAYRAQQRRHLPGWTTRGGQEVVNRRLIRANRQRHHLTMSGQMPSGSGAYFGSTDIAAGNSTYLEVQTSAG